MNLTPTGFGVIVAILLVVAVIVAVAENLRDRHEDDLYAQDILDYYCAGNGHDYEAVDGDWVCAHCGDVVRQPLNCGGLHRYETRGRWLLCSVCGFRTELPYDQEASA